MIEHQDAFDRLPTDVQDMIAERNRLLGDPETRTQAIQDEHQADRHDAGAYHTEPVEADKAPDTRTQTVRTLGGSAAVELSPEFIEVPDTSASDPKKAIDPKTRELIDAFRSRRRPQDDTLTRFVDLLKKRPV